MTIDPSADRLAGRDPDAHPMGVWDLCLTLQYLRREGPGDALEPVPLLRVDRTHEPPRSLYFSRTVGLRQEWVCREADVAPHFDADPRLPPLLAWLRESDDSGDAPA